MAVHWPASVSLCSLSPLMPVECLFKQEGRERSAMDCGRHWTESLWIETVSREAGCSNLSVFYNSKICGKSGEVKGNENRGRV